MSERVFPATVTSVHDGDSLTVMADLGFGVWRVVTVRLDGINARELAQPGGTEARDHLKAMLASTGQSIGLVSLGWDKYGDRTDALIVLPDGRVVNSQMVADGFAAVWSGKGPRPVPPWPIPPKG